MSSISVFVAFLYGGDIGKINNHLFNYLDCILLFIYMEKKQNRNKLITFIKLHIQLLITIVYVIETIELLMIITHKGYEYNWNWGGTFFYGTNSMPHTLAYLMVITIVMVIIIIIIKRNVIYAGLAVIPTFCTFISGVRMALLPAGLLVIILIDVVCSSKSKSTIIKLIKAIIILSILFVLFYDQILSSNMMAKILKRQASSLSAGRTDIWLYLFSFFSRQPDKWFFGIGDQTIYYLNSINPVYHNEIWAHSDFIQILIGKGIICFGFYIYAMMLFLKSLKEYRKNYYPNIIIVLIVSLAALNGFYNYRETMLGIPLFSVCVYLLNNEWFGYENKNIIRHRRGL